jgi:hypothetical protein
MTATTWSARDLIEPLVESLEYQQIYWTMHWQDIHRLQPFFGDGRPY